MYGISFNDKHSYRDFDITILNTRVIETPSKIKIKETVPFMNGSYDFSNLYGGVNGNRLNLSERGLIL